MKHCTLKGPGKKNYISIIKYWLEFWTFIASVTVKNNELILVLYSL